MGKMQKKTIGGTQKNEKLQLKSGQEKNLDQKKASRKGLVPAETQKIPGDKTANKRQQRTKKKRAPKGL